MNNINSRVINRSKTLKITLLVFTLLMIASVIFISNIKSHPAYLEAITTIENSKIPISTGGIMGFGIIPSWNVNDENGWAEYTIRVQGVQSDMNVMLHLNKTNNESWKVDWLSESYTANNGGNDLLIGITFIINILFAIFFILTLTYYFKRKIYIKHKDTRVVLGKIVNVRSRVETTTMPGQSNHGVLNTDFENRAVMHKTEMFKPVIEFKAENNKRYTLETKFSSSKEYKAEDKIKVIYKVNNPEKAELEDFYWFWVQLLSVFSLTFFIIGIGSSLLFFVV